MKSLKLLFSFIGISALFSCSNDYLNETSPHLMTADLLYTTASGFQAGLNGIYGNMRAERQGYTYTGSMVNYQYETGLIFYVATDDISTGGNSGGGPAQVISNPSQYNNPTNAFLRNTFEWLYVVINAANTIINRAENFGDNVDWNMGTVNHRERIIGEARLARAWAYRLLVCGWGDVPLKLDESTGTNIRSDFVRTPEQEVYAQMKEDLLIAARNIPWAPYTTGSPTKGAALHYLAETCLALGDADQAEKYLNVLIGNGNNLPGEDFGATNRSLETDYNAMFDPGKVDFAANNETLWTWQWAVNVVGGGNSCRQQTQIPRFAGAYESGVAPNPYFDRTNIGIQYSADRGGQGWGQSYITQRVFKLFYRSSKDYDPENPPSLQPARSSAAENRNYWKNFQYDDRGNDRAIRRYFLLDPAIDVIKDDAVNPSTGVAWKAKDTVWISGSTNATSATGASLIENAVGLDYRVYQNNTNNAPYITKFSYVNKGYEYRLYSNQNQMYLRLGETYLLRAEARMKKGDTEGAKNDINMLRERAHARLIDDIPGATLQDRLDFILDERTRELLGEEQRRVTLARMGRKDFLWRRIQMYNAKDRDNFTHQYVYWAIPQTVIDANINLVMANNPGYAGGPPVDMSGWQTPVQWSCDTNGSGDPDMF